MEKFSRDTIRARTVGARKHTPSEIVWVEVDGDRAPIEIRMPNVRERGRIQDRARTKPDGTRLNPAEQDVLALIDLAYVPAYDAEGNPVTGGTQKAFEDADFEVLMTQPTGSWVDVLVRTATKMVWGEVKDLGKGSGKMETSSSSATLPNSQDAIPSA